MTTKILTTALLLATAAFAPATASASYSAAAGVAQAAETIGTATMAEDGTITLTLQSQDENGQPAETKLTYKRGDADYQKILRHVRGLRPGQTKAVPAWRA